MLKHIKQFLKSEKGAETVEWVAIAAIVVTLGGLAYGSGGIGSTITNALTAVDTAVAAAAG